MADGNSLPEESTVLVPVSTIKASCWKIQRNYLLLYQADKGRVLTHKVPPAVRSAVGVCTTTAPR